MKSRKEKVKKTRLNIEDRVKILEQLENGENSATLAHKYKVSAPTIANIKKDKEKLLKCKNVTFQGKIKKGYTSIGNIFLDQYLYKWFVQKESNGKHVTGSMIQQKALEINRTLNGPKSFKASSGFLWNFTKRHNIKLSCHNKRNIKKDGKEYLEQDSSNDFDQELIEDNAEQERRVSNDGEVIKSEHQINNQLNENNEMERVKKTRLSIEDRIKILERFENGENIVTLACEYNVSVPTIANIKKDKKKLLKCKNALVTFHGKIKKGYTGFGNIFLDQYLYKWFVQKKSNGKHVSGSMIQQKALEINRTLNGPKSFKASSGFLWNFTKRHNIKLSCHNKRNIKKDGKEYLDQDSSNDFDQELIEDNAEQERRVSNDGEVIKSEHQMNNQHNENNEMEKVKKTRLSIEDRVKILEQFENGENIVTLARKYKVSTPTIANIKKNKEKLLKCKNALVTFQGNNKKGYTGIGNIYLDQYLYKWFVQKKSNGKHVTWSMIQQKALEINRTLNGPKTFKASLGFIWNFTKRHNIKLFSKKKKTKRDGKKYLDPDLSNNFNQNLIEDNAEQKQRLSNNLEVFKSKHQINDEFNENNEIESLKYTRLSIEDRVKILERLENEENSVILAREYKVSGQTIANIKKDKEKLLKCKNALVTFQGNNKKGYSGIRNIFLDQYLYKWFVQKKSNGKHVMGWMIQQKALEINRILNGPESFKASQKFLWNFTKRHNIKLSCCNKRSTKKDGKENLNQDSSNNFVQELIEDNAEQERRVSNDGEVIKSEHQINNELSENNEMERVNVKYTRLNIEDRFKILERLENGENSVTLACEYKVSEATIEKSKKDIPASETFSLISICTNGLSKKKAIENM